MVNTNNTKFTFNKKGFALSLACVGLLATAGNAAITPENTVQVVTGSEYNVKVSNPSGSITVTGNNTSLGFVTNATVYINAGNALTIEGNGQIGTLNVWNASEDKGFSLSGAGLTFDTKIGTLNLGTTTQAGASGAITMGSGGALTIKNTVGTINLNNIIHTDQKGSGATITLNQATIGNFNFNQLIESNSKDGSNLNITNTSGVITNFTIASGSGYQAKDANASGGFTLTNSGTITKFINKGLLEGNTKSDVTIKSTGTIGTFENAGKINTATISGSSIGTFNNAAAGVINNSTIKVNVNDFNNSGTITTADDSDIKVFNSFNNAEKKDFILKGTLTLQGATDVKDAKTTFNNAGNFSAGTISIVDNVLKFNNTATGIIKNSTINGTGTIQAFTNAGVISSDGTAENTLTVNATDFTNEKTIKFVSGSITIAADNFTNAKDAQIDFTGAKDGLKITANKTFDNAGTIKGISGASTVNAGTITLKTDADSERNATFAGTNSGLIQVDTISFEGGHKSFENSGTISGGTISATGNDGIFAFTNTATGVIKGSKITVDVDDFNNLGTITTVTGSNIEVANSFNNAEKADFKLGGTITLTSEVRDTKTTFNNAGYFSGGTIKIDKDVLTFNNTATGVIEDTVISGGGTIKTLTNDGVMSVKAHDAKVAAFQNTKEFTLNNTGTLNVLNSFNNTEKAILTADANATIQLGNNKNANTTETTFNNAGTIDGKTKLTISTADGWVKSFTNTGLIDNATITSGAATRGIVTFTNTGTIDNSTLQVNVVNFNNLEGGLIDFGSTTKNSINLSGALDKTASFNNAGTIDNLASAISVNTDVTNVSFKNSGSIYQGATANTAVLSLGASNVLDFNNSGTIALASTNTSGAITAVAGAKANIINTGAITLGNGGVHMDLTNIAAAKDAPFVVKEWHLSNIGSADAYNGKYTSDGTDKIVVKGFSGGITTGTSKLRFDKGSIVIDPIKNPKMVSGQPYLLDRIVVDNTGAAVEEIHKDNGTAGASYNNLIAAAYDLNKDTNTYTLKAGVEDPRLVTIDTIRSSDPVFEIYGVDAYASDGKVGEVITVSGATTTRKGDGIIDSFQVGVNASKSAGAAVVQSAVNNSITRNAFVGNVINTAVNSALASLNNLNRVSYNDEEVDFEKLEKYAAVSSDVTDQTYAKDSNVYVMPYYRSTSVDLATNDSLDADTYGIVLGGNKNLGNAGVIGLFLGYENSDGSADKIDTEDDTFFGGINYYKTLGGTSSYDYFVKGMARLAKTSTDVTTKVNSGTSSADTFSYGVEANVGMNFYNGIHTFTPEVGLSYDRVSVDGFIQSNGLSNDDQDINLVIGKVGINWLAQFTESLSTNVGVGIRYNFNDDFDANIGTGNQRYSATTDLGDFYYYVNLGVNYAITQNWELGVMYNGDFSSDASSHSGFVKLGYWW